MIGHRTLLTAGLIEALCLEVIPETDGFHVIGDQEVRGPEHASAVPPGVATSAQGILIGTKTSCRPLVNPPVPILLFDDGPPDAVILLTLGVGGLDPAVPSVIELTVQVGPGLGDGHDVVPGEDVGCGPLMGFHLDELGSTDPVRSPEVHGLLDDIRDKEIGISVTIDVTDGEVSRRQGIVRSARYGPNIDLDEIDVDVMIGPLLPLLVPVPDLDVPEVPEGAHTVGKKVEGQGGLLVPVVVRCHGSYGLAPGIAVDGVVNISAFLLVEPEIPVGDELELEGDLHEFPFDAPEGEVHEMHHLCGIEFVPIIVIVPGQGNRLRGAVAFPLRPGLGSELADTGEIVHRILGAEEDV